MAKILNEYKVNKLNSGLNVTDSTINMPDSDVVIADNVEYVATGGVKSINPPLQIGDNIKINGIDSIKVLGGCIFQDTEYLICSNGTVSRWVYKTTGGDDVEACEESPVTGYTRITSTGHGLYNGDTVTIVGTTSYNGTHVISSVDTDTFDIHITYSTSQTGTWSNVYFKQANAQNFSSTALVNCQVYNNKIWFINGTTTTIDAKDCVLYFLDTSNNITGLSTAECGLPTGLTTIYLHLQRIWVGGLNTMFMTIMKPNGDAGDWDTTTVYTGADTAGYFIIDNNTEDYIVTLKEKFGALIVYRKKSIWLLQGASVLQMYITRKTNSTTGVFSARSIAQSDNVDYFYSNEGVKIFNGQTVKEGATNVDTISTDTLDRKIKPIIDNFSNKTIMVGYAFRDKYYLSDAVNRMVVFDEVTLGWSQILDFGAEIFLEKNSILYFAIRNKFYQIGADVNGSMTSTVRTKDFNCGIDVFWKIFQKLLPVFITKSSTNTFTIYWYINGESVPTGSITISIPSNTINWDSGLLWDEDNIRWDTESINFLQTKVNKLNSGYTIAIAIQATGTNRFELDNFSLLFETIKREA